MKLKELFENVEILELTGNLSGNFRGKVTSDSRAVQEGDLFVACRGARMDGHDFLSQAVLAKADILVYEELPENFFVPRKILGVKVQNSQRVLSRLLLNANHCPDQDVKIIGVTGTNGKTTVSYLLHQLLKIKQKSAYLGTLWYEMPSKKLDAINTTPGSEVLIPLLSDMKKSQVRSCVMEVSSHALAQSRVYGIQYEVAVFTQLTQDHLDYHPDLESYFMAKRNLFVNQPAPRHRLINADCAFGRRLLKEFPDAKSYSLETAKADFFVKKIETSFEGSRFLLCYNGKEAVFNINLPLRHNVYNAVAVLGSLALLGYDPADFKQALSHIAGIPGRFERMTTHEKFSVFVDYAHTPDAIKNVLEETSKLTPKRVITVFGCGGDRDRDKRPKMTEVACAYSDVVILTTDNPRSENPENIFSDMKKGIKKTRRAISVLEVHDREQAIRSAIHQAEDGDVLLILGKGHEDYQILGDRKIPFDDRVIARDALKQKNRVLSS